MATGKSSTKRKSSSSHKKKSIKKSSEVKKRRSKSHRRNKSKKLRQRDASVSYSDEDSRTEGSLSLSPSDSEVDYRSRRARSRTRRDAKLSGKKRIRRSSSSSEDSEYSPRQKKKKVSKRSVDRKDSPSRKKKKGLKRKDESEGKKKKTTHKIKRRRRDKSVDSLSSDSRSCSAYSHSGESKFERSRGRSVGRKRGKRSASKMDIERDRYMYRSRSCSSGSDPGFYRSEVGLTSENCSRHVQSVVIDERASNREEGRYQSKDENKAEIIQDYDDYPSGRSNDSYDGSRKKDSSHHTYAVSEKNRNLDDLVVERALISKNRTTEFTQRSREDSGTQPVDSNSTKMINKTDVSTGIVSSEVDDLESVLRLKALENLKRFRGRLDTNTSDLAIKNNESENAVMQLSTAKADTTKPQICKEGGEIVASAKDMIVHPMKRIDVPTMQRNPAIQKNASDNAVVKQPSTVKANLAKPRIHEEAGHMVAASEDMVVQPIKNVTVPTVQRNSAPESNSQILDRNYKPSHSKVPLRASTHVVMGAGSDQDLVSGKTIERNNTNVCLLTNKSTRNASTVEQESPRDSSISHKTPISPDSPKAKLLDSNNIGDRNVAETTKAANSCSNAHGAEVIKTYEPASLEASSFVTPVTGEHDSNEPGEVVKGSSQFEQKTMSVMRGGEMVQVSYKVYIPKKPPALARRKLQR